MRLNRYLSQCGIGSRRGCEQIITEGRVQINGKLVTELATQVEPGDRVLVDGKPVKAEQGIVIALHKPRGFICTRSDTHKRSTIYDLLPANLQSLHHVGRLDKDSEGLILLTNRGDLSHRLIHPSQGAEKEYEVVVDQPMDHEVMAKLVKGMFTEEGFAKAERAWLASDYRAHLVLKQGLKRQIRLMMYQLGFEVERLTRIRIGWLELRGLPKGGWKELSAAEVERFFSKEGNSNRPTRKNSPAKPAPASPVSRGESLDDDSDGFSFAPAKKRGPSPSRRQDTTFRKSSPAPRGSRSRFDNGDREQDARPRGPRRSAGAGGGTGASDRRPGLGGSGGRSRSASASSSPRSARPNKGGPRSKSGGKSGPRRGPRRD